MNAVYAQQQPQDPPVADDEDEVSEDQLDESIEETFPASDPISP
ncbi:hypothetical protein [Pseudomonas oryzihabitans]|uniref:Uncharacterized protein n=1 Tax=Pseudomonas oryzihabitans TaxID=47885 RepID=A0AAJ2BLB8_9PSED|nr:hypothetical protein [Pseudomonas psychrotolerans]MDR6232614.1 hypothetical protein [Pseudomonas psychrotolerans]MDR6358456.1 hypothetical protein [Pseudomonas psychrotolerans]MDR6680018.1 hypothetical protein [Pseudomonas psychrotolerans]